MTFNLYDVDGWSSGSAQQGSLTGASFHLNSPHEAEPISACAVAVCSLCWHVCRWVLTVVPAGRSVWASASRRGSVWWRTPETRWVPRLVCPPREAALRPVLVVAAAWPADRKSKQNSLTNPVLLSSLAHQQGYIRHWNDVLYFNVAAQHEL